MPPTKARQTAAEATATRPVTITAVVDCPGILASRSTRGNLYLYDTNKASGSTGLGTEELQTPVKKGDQILWNIHVLECETFASIDGIEIDEQICVPEKRVYPSTDISYWTATVLKDIPELVPYQIRFRLGSLTEPITSTSSPALVR
jgi:hypothetical protein